MAVHRTRRRRRRRKHYGAISISGTLHAIDRPRIHWRSLTEARRQKDFYTYVVAVLEQGETV